jgi:hypothetical protein
MAFAGLVITILGFLVAVASLSLSASNMGRLVIVLVGIVISLVGILGVINPAYMKHAVWKKR